MVEFEPIIQFLSTFPQWFQMLIVFIGVLGGGLYILIRTLLLALKAGLLDFFKDTHKQATRKKKK